MKIDTFANRLKYAMNLLGMKQIDLANKTKIDKSLINKYLKGIAEAGNDNLPLLALALNVNPIWLMGYDLPMNINDPLRNEHDEELEKIAVQLGGQILYIDKDKPLTKEDVLELTNILLEVVDEQKQKNTKKSAKNDSSSKT